MKRLILAFILLAVGAYAQSTGAGQIAIFGPSSGGGGGAVSSVFGRTGAVVADPTDYESYYAQLTANNSFSGVNTFSGSFIFTPATITIAANSGLLTITNYFNVATNGANTTIVMSAAGTNGQRVLLNAINSDTAHHTWTIDNPSGTDPTFTASSSLTTPIVLQSNGTSWAIVGGAPTINDLGTATLASGDFIPFWDSSAGVMAKASFDQGVLTTDRPTFANVQIPPTTLTYSATTNLDFSSMDGKKIITVTGNLTFTTSNLAVGKSVRIKLVASGGPHTLTFPAGWTFVGAAAPASLASGKTAILTLDSDTTADSGVVAAYSAQP